MADQPPVQQFTTPVKDRHSEATLSPTSSNGGADRPTSSNPLVSPHRMSFSETLRQHPRSPRHVRQPSIGMQGLQDLLNNPPFPNKTPNPYTGKDWRRVPVGEITDPNEIHWVENDATVETATKVERMSTSLQHLLTVTVTRQFRCSKCCAHSRFQRISPYQRKL